MFDRNNLLTIADLEESRRRRELASAFKVKLMRLINKNILDVPTPSKAEALSIYEQNIAKLVKEYNLDPCSMELSAAIEKQGIILAVSIINATSADIA